MRNNGLTATEVNRLQNGRRKYLRLAKEEDAMKARLDPRLGSPMPYIRRTALYRKKAEACDMQIKTGLRHCVCHMIPETKCWDLDS